MNLLIFTTEKIVIRQSGLIVLVRKTTSWEPGEPERNVFRLVMHRQFSVNEFLDTDSLFTDKQSILINTKKKVFYVKVIVNDDDFVTTFRVVHVTELIRLPKTKWFPEQIASI